MDVWFDTPAASGGGELPPAAQARVATITRQVLAAVEEPQKIVSSRDIEDNKNGVQHACGCIDKSQAAGGEGRMPGGGMPDFGDGGAPPGGSGSHSRLGRRGRHPQWKVVWTTKCGKYHIRKWWAVPCRDGSECARMPSLTVWCGSCPFQHEEEDINGVTQVTATYTLQEAEAYVSQM